MKVRHIATADIYGGAAIAAFRLHTGLRRIGVDSSMLTSIKLSDDPTVDQLTPDRSFLGRVSRRLARARTEADFRRYRHTLSPHLEAFSDDRAPGGASLPPALGPADVYHLHWVADLLDYRRFFRALTPGVPLVWTLHDMNPFTGGCHYTLGCEGFTAACGRCPQLGSDRDDDLSRAIHRRKRQSLGLARRPTTAIVATSQWMQAEARRSSLLGDFDVRLIPYGLDTEVFRPHDRGAARRRLGLPQDRKVVLFAAQSVGNHRKGFDLLARALVDLREENVRLASIGTPASGPVAANHHPLGEITSQEDLAWAYSAADLFVSPARHEAFGQVVFEAMACGVPVVTFDVGGIPDMVRPMQTGLLAERENVGALRDAIDTMLANDVMRAHMGAECRRVAVAEYGLEIQARSYSRLYQELAQDA